LLARNLELQWSQLLLPLGVGLVNFLDTSRTQVLAGVAELDHRHRVFVVRWVGLGDTHVRASEPCEQACSGDGGIGKENSAVHVFLRSPTSTKRESKRLHAWIEEFNFKGSVFHGPLLPDELIQTVLLDSACTGGVGVAAVVLAGWRAVKLHCETNGLAVLRRSQHQVDVAGMKAKRDLSGTV